MDALLRLPAELVSAILEYVLLQHPSVTDILVVNSTFFHITQFILHRNLRFRTIRQLRQFAMGSGPLACQPQTVTIELAGGVANHHLFTYIKDTLCRAFDVNGGGSTDVDKLQFTFNSHYSAASESLEQLYSALSISRPRTFIWTGPDPPHHFSIAIVPRVTLLLFQAMPAWTDLQHLHLTNVAFPSSNTASPLPSDHQYEDIFPTIPSLQTVHLGQATFLSPLGVARLCANNSATLRSVRLVDTYLESIWGRRLRRSDVEQAVAQLTDAEPERSRYLELMRRLIVCEARTERIMGGDRAEGDTPLSPLIPASWTQ
ncbi:hypothetical protein PC9H_000529 [Pleurotus ostreatus]|uniref:Uncharacterized protein n=1 Tax=Pleurotus ostreatus TaxID=5322 RepID=A0A8H7A192_PLEOS|nr:uncharacterized protein PC9H_000529 [Pleurotus ostreatus]KAF7440185.1 hypothetical protein PC9H_000529 [Pleurotus ostreatus]KAJ8700541.1 hypothetical protein PTI98_003556 [Pleurotus ostreatus]